MEFGQEIHTDLWGPAPVESRGGKKYWDTYIDDKTRLTNIYFLRTKDEAFEATKKYAAWVHTQFGKKLKVLNSDRGGEYLGIDFTTYLESQGIVHKLSVHDTHQESGVAEQRNCTIGERMRVLLHASGLPKNMWAEAAHHAVWLLNRTTTKAVEGMTPYEVAFGTKPNLKGLREFGEKVYVRVEKGNKLGGRVHLGKWLGVDDESKGVRVYWPDTRTITVERNTYFNNSLNSHLEGEEDVHITMTDISPDVDAQTDPANESERGKRIQKPSQRVQDLLEGRGTWSDKARDPLLPPGVQLAVEGQAYDDDTNDWLTGIPDHVDGYALVAAIGDSEALEP